MNVNLGCGRSIYPGWVNVDLTIDHGADIACDLDRPEPWSFPHEIRDVEQWYLSHVVEHLAHPLNLFQAMWEASAPDSVALVRCPYGSSDDAWADPTHRRPWFVSSWGFLAQPHFWKADYGYRGDWQAVLIQLAVDNPDIAALDDDAIAARLDHARNIIGEQFVVLRADHPARPADGALQEIPPVHVVRRVLGEPFQLPFKIPEAPVSL